MLASAIIFPRLALGLSGFETGVSVMPLIRGYGINPSVAVPVGRIRNTRKLLATAALIMSVMLMLSSFVTTLLMPEEAYREGGKAAGRAIAYLAHGLLGDWFGTVYDASTILILWFAGASAMAGLLHLDSALPAALRHGAAVGGLSAAAGAVAVHGLRDRHAGVQGRCGGAGRSLRDGRAGADALGGDRRGAGAVARGPAGVERLLLGWWR